jgi:hypothetical protein
MHCDGWEMSTGVYEMKKLLATIALLCLSSTVLAHDEQIFGVIEQISGRGQSD